MAEGLAIRVVVKQEDQIVLQPKVRVGEPFHVEITVTTAKNVVVNLPAQLVGAPFEVTRRKESSASAGEGLVDRRFDLMVVAWEPGTHTLPPIPLDTVVGSDAKQVTTESIRVEVVPLVADETQAELRPVAGPVTVYQPDWRLVGVGAGLVGAILLFVVVGWLRRRWRRRARVARPEPAFVDPRPPHEIALAKLAALAKSGPAADPRPYYFAMTEIVREYLGRRFGFDALEQTTTELMASLARVPEAEPYRSEVAGWLEDCDLVKFANLRVPAGEARTKMDAALALVRRSAPPPPAEVVRA